jgi:hypothetical protein
MKRKIKIWWPVQTTQEEEIEVDIAEGVDLDDWLCYNEERLIEEASHGDHDGPLDYPLDVGSAGAKFVE